FAGIIERGGRVVWINPRRIESARTGEHHFIRPDTDVFFLAAFCNEIFRRDAIDHELVNRTMKNLSALQDTVKDWTPQRQAQVTGISAETLNELVDAYLAADGAALNMATGVNQGRSGTLCYWLLESISAITGNFDRQGGNLIGEGIIDFALQAKDDPIMKLGFHRNDDLPSVSGQQPAAMLADDILTGQVKGLFVEASNPLLAVPNPGNRLEQALGELELLVCIDWFRNETGNMAHYILPANTWMERPGMPYALQSFAGCTPTPYLYAADKVLEPPEGVREEWWMYTRLCDMFGITIMGNRAISGVLKLAARLTHTPLGFINVPKMLISGMLKQSGQPDIKAMLKNHKHGLRLSDNPGKNFLGTDRVLTADGKVDLGPPDFVTTFNESVEALFEDEHANLGKMKLIGKREIKRMNSASANSERLVKDKTNYAYLSPEDAQRLGLTENDFIDVSSAVDKITIPVRITDEMMAGVVAIPQCWGHQKADGLKHAQNHPGVNSNFLAGDGYANIEKLSGMAHLSGIPVEVVRSYL
ncbi:MAG: molybdopterin-dependent oxidoreductase, partial [Halioglobus sp.]